MRIILLSFIVLVSSTSIEALEKKSFSSVNEALVFITNCIEKSDSDTLFEACIGKNYSNNKNYYKHILKKLRELNKVTPLMELYGNTHFPKNSESFKLGGHGFKWGHLHIDFVKKDKKWYLSSIWQCR